MSHVLLPIKLSNPLTGNTKPSGPTDTSGLAKLEAVRKQSRSKQ